MRAWLSFWGGAVLPFIIYCWTLAPDLTWIQDGGDGGDLVVAAYSLGIPHPPGYPAYTILAHLFTLLPVGTVAWRVHLFSAISAAIAAGLIALIVFDLYPDTKRADGLLGSWVAAWAWALFPLVWGQAIIAEVYAPFATWVALTIWIAVCYFQHSKPFAPLLLGIVWAMAFGFHLTAILLLPVVAWRLWQARNSILTWIFFVGGFLLGCSQWIYLPLRAGQGVFTWGDPTTLTGWWWLASGELYRGFMFASPPQVWLNRLGVFSEWIVTGFGPIALWLGVLEIARGLKARIGLWSALLVSFILFAVFAIGYNTSDSDRYLIPALLIVAIFIGGGAVNLLMACRGRWGTRGVTAVWSGGMVLFVLLVGVNSARMEFSQVPDAPQLREVLNQLPPNAIVVSEEDRTSFALWYFQFVEQRRVDVLTLDRDLWQFGWYRSEVGVRAHSDLNVALQSLSRPVCRVWVDASDIHFLCAAAP